MSKACGLTGILHSASDKTLLTPAGEVSVMRTIYPDSEVTATYEKEFKDGKKKTMLPETKKVQEAVRDFCIATANAALAAETKEDCAKALRAYVGPIRDDNAYNGDYQKTYRVAGIVNKSGTQYAAKVSQVDKVSLPKTPEAMDRIKELVGAEFFNEHFTKEVTISIKKEIIENKKSIKELTTLLKKVMTNEDIQKYFKMEEEWGVAKGFDEAQYGLNKATIEFLLGEVKMSADAVADASFDPKNHL